MKGKITEFAMCDARGIDCINKRLEKILFQAVQGLMMINDYTYNVGSTL